MFVSSEAGISTSLRQGEIISNLIQIQINLDSIIESDNESLQEKNYSADNVLHPYAIVVTQDCDLEQDYYFRFHERGKDRHKLPSILFCEVIEAEELVHGNRNETIFQVGPIRNNFRNNDDYRFHFIQSIPKEYDAFDEGLPELGIEFKRYFTIPTDEVYHRLNLFHAQRRCRLQSPYLEHFCTRFHYYHYRIALPEQYESE